MGPDGTNGFHFVDLEDLSMWTAQPLTDEAVLGFLCDVQRDELRMPSIREVAEHFGHRSPTSVQRCFDRLKESGLLRKAGRQWALTEAAVQPKGLPVLGQIAAGRPIEAIEHRDIEEYIDLGGVYDPARHFGLLVRGDSMIEAHIMDGDVAVIRSQVTCQNGDIVAAVLDGTATLKRYLRRSDHIVLKPENSKLSPLKVRDVEIRGVMVGLLRRCSTGERER